MSPPILRCRIVTRKERSNPNQSNANVQLHSRLKSNFVVIKEEHNALLLESKQEVEATFEHEKWLLVSNAMQAKGADKYKPVELQRQYKNLLKLGVELKAERDERIQANPNLVKKGKGKSRRSDGDKMDED